MLSVAARQRILFRVCLVALATSCAIAAEKQGQEHRHEPGINSATGNDWTDRPLITPAGRNPDRASILLGARNFVPDALMIHSPEPESQARMIALVGNAAKVTPDMPGAGGFYWVSARVESPDSITVASTIWSFGSKGPAPRDMLAMPKEKLEIIPEPATLRYRENEQWSFHVRYLGQPWAGAELRLETENGSRQTVRTNEQGIANLRFPMDFDSTRLAKAADLGRVQAKFVVSVERQENRQRLLTAFNGNYMPDRMRERSIAWGIGFTLLGMTLALPLLRRKEETDD